MTPAATAVGAKWWLVTLLLLCCTLTPWLQKLHASEHLVVHHDEYRCQICQQGSLADVLPSPQLITAVSLLLYVLSVAGILPYLLSRRFTPFSIRASPLTTLS